MGEPVARVAPPLVLKDMKNYERLQLFWFTVHYLCGILGVISGGIAAVAAGKTAENIQSPYWGVAAATLTALVTFLGPLRKGEVYKRAYYLLQNSVIRFENIAELDVKWLLERHIEVQQIVLTGDAIKGSLFKETIPTAGPL